MDTCSYPQCKCPFDAPADPGWCARGLPHGTLPPGAVIYAAWGPEFEALTAYLAMRDDPDTPPAQVAAAQTVLTARLKLTTGLDRARDLLTTRLNRQLATNAPAAALRDTRELLATLDEVVIP